MNTDRININIDEDMNAQLIKDICDFNIIKKDGSPNKSKFVCLLIENFMDEYIGNINNNIELTTKLIENNGINEKNASEIATNIMFYAKNNSFFENGKKKRKNIQWHIRINNSVIDKTNEILYLIPSTIDFSAFFRNMFLIFLSLPRYKRELYLHKKCFEKINDSIKKHGLNFKYRNYQLEEVIYPLAIEHNTKQEMFNYVIAYTGKDIKTYHLSYISNVIIKNRNKTIIPDNYDIVFKLMKKNGFQFGITKPEYNYIELSKDELKTFKRRYHDRPEYIKKEKLENGNFRLYFDCSIFQLKNAYLHPFERDIEIHKYDPNK